jgi:hypothetical protein
VLTSPSAPSATPKAPSVEKDLASTAVEQERDEFDLDNMDPEEVDAAIEEALASLPMEEVADEATSPSTKDEGLNDALRSMDGPPLPSAPAPKASASDVQMDFEMDPAMQAKLTSAILQTPHEGFRPTLRITGSGEVLLEFRPM